MTDEENKKLQELMQYAQLGAPQTPTIGWGLFQPNPAPEQTTASDTSVIPVDPVVGE
jgi:hypothetical protein